MKLLLIALVSMFATISLTDTYKKDIIGIWVYDHYSEGVTIYTRQPEFEKDLAGIQFLEYGKLIMRRNAGWCGTPPISYANEEGSYEWMAEDRIRTVSKYWGGELTRGYTIHSLGQDTLKVVSFDIEKESE